MPAVLSTPRLFLGPHGPSTETSRALPERLPPRGVNRFARPRPFHALAWDTGLAKLQRDPVLDPTGAQPWDRTQPAPLTEGPVRGVAGSSRARRRSLGNQAFPFLF